MIKQFLKYSVLALSVSAVLTGCGGSDDNNGHTSPTTTVKGRVIDGPLAGSTVVFNDCQSKTTVTDNEGRFNFPEGCTESLITISGGLDTATNLPFTGELKAPRKAATIGQNNSVIVSPITTLIEAAGGTSTAATQIANALGLNGIDLLNVDPMQNKAVYAKTVAVQQLVEEISESIASLGSTSSSTELNTQVYSALKSALTSTNQNSNLLTNVDVIKSTIETAVTNVKTSLPTNLQTNLSNVAQNLATLTANIIADNVKTVEGSIEKLSPEAFSSGVESIKNATQDTIVSAKNSVTVEKIVDALLPVLTVAPSTALEDALEKISEAVATNSATSATEIAEAIDTINAIEGINIDKAEVTQEIIDAHKFYADYLKLNGFNVQSTEYSISNLNTSLANPINTQSLNNIVVGLNAVGKHKSSTVTVATALSLKTDNQNLTVTSDKLNLSFDANGTLTKATLPAGAKINIASSLNSLNSSVTLNADQDALSNGKIALNLTTFGKISASVANQLSNINLSGKTVTTTAVIQGSPYIAISESALASQYTVNNTTGYGASAKFKVN